MTNMETMQEHADWKRMRFKRNKVWVAMDARGRPRIEKGKVLIKYQLDQAHQYWVHPKSVRPLDEAPTASDAEPRSRTSQVNSYPAPVTSDSVRAPNAIHIYTDGACSGNPGPAGIGVVMQYGPHRKEISRSIGTATNNIAELEAVKAALETVKKRSLPVVVHTDSNYVLGLLDRGWKAKKNQRLVEAIRQLTHRFGNLQFVKVKGHSGHPDNERADQLAVAAISKNG